MSATEINICCAAGDRVLPNWLTQTGTALLEDQLQDHECQTFPHRRAGYRFLEMARKHSWICGREYKYRDDVLYTQAQTCRVHS